MADEAPDRPQDWISLLRDQAASIADASYLADPARFAQAPADIAALAADLDVLAASMAARDAVQKALTHEVHHRVKNHLQIVSSLLNMQASRSQNADVAQALGQTRARMDALALIHRLLYEENDDGSTATIDSARLLNELCSQLRQWHRHRTSLQFSFTAHAYPVPLAHAVPLALFAVEAISNALAHAFPADRSGTITLISKLDNDGQARITITDNGVGQAACQPELGAKPMGKQLMQAFASQLGGMLEITCNGKTGNGKTGNGQTGTRLCLSFPAEG